MASQISAGASGGNYEWSGVGISPDGLFSPTAAGMGTHSIDLKYTEGSCEFFANLMIPIFEKPTVELDFDNPVCETDVVQIDYTGSASPSANYNWNFGNINVVNNAGFVTYLVDFPGDGTYDFTLQVEENGCVSNLVTRSFSVEKALDPIINNCTFSTNEVVFDWADIAGAIGYRVNSISRQTGVLDGST